MKKFLSLVMALVMTMSLVTISAGATFTDNSKVDYKEAVDVISTMGIVGGYADGSFRPEGTLTRGAAAKIICNMMLGVETASQLPSIASYKDVPAGSTYAPYIAYLKNEGVVGGYADNTFKPGNTLTGYAFLKMLLGALGYDASVEGLAGDGWQINVAKLAKKADLYKGNDDFVGNAPATRQEACLYALNTMLAKTVTYDKKDVIQIGDITIKNNSEAKPGAEFYKDNFGTLKIYKNVTDSQGRPAVKYTYGKANKEIGKYGTEADHVIVASSNWSDNLTELKKALDNKDLTGFDKDTSAYYVNGDTSAKNATINSGDVVEVFVDKDDANKITRIVVSQYTLVEVTKMDTKVTNKKDIEDKVEGYITVKGSGLSNVQFKSTKFAGFDADFVKGTKLLVCLNGTNNEVFASEVAETVEGKITAVKGSKVTIDGETYTNLGSALAINDEGVFYLNKAGKIISADLTASGAAEKYIYVYNGKSEAGKTGDDGAKLDRVTTVYTVDSTGTQASYKVTDAATVKALFNESSDYAFRGDTVIPYKVESGKLVMTSGAADWTVKEFNDKDLGKVSKDTTAVAKVGAYYANNDTQFVFASEKDQTMKFSTAVGYKNVGIKSGTTFFAVAKDTDIKLVFVAGKDKGAAADETYSLGVVLDKDATETNDDDDKTLYTYDVVIDGVETTVTSKKSLSLADGAAYKFVMDGDYVDSVEALSSNTITKVASDDSYIIAGAMYEISDDVTVYTIHDNWKSEGGIAKHDNYTVSTGAVLEEGLTIFTFADKDDNLTIFFVKSDAADYV